MSETPHNPEQAVERSGENEVNQEALANLKNEIKHFALQKNSQETKDTDNTEKMREVLELGAELGRLYEELEIVVEAMNAFQAESDERLSKWLKPSLMDKAKNLLTFGQSKKKVINEWDSTKATSADLWEARDAIRRQIQPIVLKLDSLERDAYGHRIPQFDEAAEARKELYGKGQPFTWGSTDRDIEFQKSHEAHMLEEKTGKRGSDHLLEN